MKLFVILLLTKTHRHSDSFLTTWHRDAALLPTWLIMGLYTLCWRRRVVWLLDERCGRPTGEDAAAEERDPNRETETEGGKGGSAGAGGSLGRERARVKQLMRVTRSIPCSQVTAAGRQKKGGALVQSSQVYEMHTKRLIKFRNLGFPKGTDHN